MSIIYVTKDMERATGIDMERYTEFYVLTNRSPLADAMYFKFPERVLLNDEKELNTYELLQYYASTIQSVDKQAEIVVFKNSRQIERFCQKQGWKLLNPPAELAEKFEQKISQLSWLKTLQLDAELPDTLVSALEGLNYAELAARFGNPFIMQYNLGHTGEGTKYITSPYDLEKEILATPKREVKIMREIKGQTYTINACVCPNDVRLGRVAKQITGHPALTDSKWATVGNDWVAAQMLYPEDKPSVQSRPEEYIPSVAPIDSDKSHGPRIENLTKQLGAAMRLERWVGLFGIDVLIEQNTSQLFLLEVNARQQSGATFETQVAHTQGAAGPMDWHLHCLSHYPPAYPNKQYEINSSQIFLRTEKGDVYNKLSSLSQIGEYTKDLDLQAEKPQFDLAQDNQNLFIVPKATTSEILRIQSNQPVTGILADYLI